MMKLFSVFILLLFTSLSYGTDIPTGQDSPEGVACDAIQAYIRCDAKAWLKTLVRPIYGEENNKEYLAFTKQMLALMKKNKADSSFAAPKIIQCYKARPFSKNGPGSLAYAVHEFTANRFVDVQIELPDGQKTNLRYHVLRDTDEKWYFEPRPDLCPLLSMGLNKEEPSTEVWKNDSGKETKTETKQDSPKEETKSETKKTDANKQ